jgi:hypothetical protein
MRSSSALMIAIFGGRCPLSTLLTVAGRTGCDFEQEFVIVHCSKSRHNRDALGQQCRFEYPLGTSALRPIATVLLITASSRNLATSIA